MSSTMTTLAENARDRAVPQQRRPSLDRDGDHGSLLQRAWPLIRYLRQHQGLPRFIDEHARLYAQAQETHTYSDVAAHYYALMGQVIELAYGSSWIFCPPNHRGQSRTQAIAALHRRIGALLQVGRAKLALDLGCGLGGAARAIASSSRANIVGVTLSAEECARANALNAASGMADRCKVVQGNYLLRLPFPDAHFDAVYSIYSFKYLHTSELATAFAQARRVLKPGGVQVVYDAVLTDRYDAHNPLHTQIVQRICYSTGMPALHTQEELLAPARQAGLRCITAVELSQGIGWHHFLDHSRALRFLLRSAAVTRLIQGLEKEGILPPGFAAFNRTFLAGTVNALVDAGRLGIVSFSRLLVFR